MPKPTEAQKAFNQSGTWNMDKTALRRAGQIAGQRTQTPYVRDEPHCVVCLMPRDRRSFPVCDTCSARRKAGT